MIAAALLLTLAGAPPELPGTIASCARAHAARSVEHAGSTPVQHTFQNGEQVPLQLAWIDPQGKRTALGVIAPGAYRSLQTYVGHQFILADPDDKCRAAVRIDDIFSGTFIGSSRYRPADIAGWHVYLDQALVPNARPAKPALAALETMLRDVEHALPPAALARVRTTPIFLLDHSGPGGMFHYAPDWLVAHGRTVDFTNAIEISDADMFIDTARTQPWAVLHELAHAYCVKLTDAERADLEATYRRALAKGLYREVKRYDGSVGPAYAAGNALEYFAELSEAHFGRNDFFPFTRAELAAYDPEGEALLARLWR